MADDYADEPYMWESVYELAVTEKNPEHRQQLLIAAQDAILQRARALQESGGSDLECTALEDAASFLKELKQITQKDGVGKHVEVGEHESL
jgi:hypothetical protein